jgi:hypothetical protein
MARSAVLPSDPTSTCPQSFSVAYVPRLTTMVVVECWADDGGDDSGGTWGNLLAFDSA